MSCNGLVDFSLASFDHKNCSILLFAFLGVRLVVVVVGRDFS